MIAFPLVVGGKWFSPHLIDEPGEGHRIFGEAFDFGDEGLDALDRLEGTHLPNGYRRFPVAVADASEGSVLDAWIYARDRATIEGFHTDPLEEYGLDPRYVVPSKRTTEF